MTTGEAIVFWILGPIALPARWAWSSPATPCTRRCCLVADDVLAGRALHGAAGAVPRLRADHRLHRRGDDAVPVRAHAGRAGQPDSVVEVLRGQRRRGARCWASGWRCCWSRRSARVAAPRCSRSAWPRRRGRSNVSGIGRLVFTKYLFAVRAHLGAADHRGARGDGAGATPSRRRTPSAASAQTVDARLRGEHDADLPAARPRRLRHRQLGRRARAAARTARSPRSRSRRSSTSVAVDVPDTATPDAHSLTGRPGPGHGRSPPGSRTTSTTPDGTEAKR